MMRKFLRDHPTLVQYVVTLAVVGLLLTAGVLALRKYGSEPAVEETPTPVADADFPEEEMPLRAIPITDLANKIDDGEVAALEIGSGKVLVELVDGTQAVCHVADVIGTLTGLAVDPLELRRVEITEVIPSAGWRDYVWLVVVAVLLFGFMYIGRMAMRRLGSGGGGSGFGKSRARVANGDDNKPSVTSDDVAGCDGAKAELAEVIDFLRSPEKYIALGIKVPNVLMVGPPGTGKTLMAKAVAGEAGVPFLSISGSEFVEMYVGVGASRVRDLFDKARKSAPSIIFIDEVDGVGGARGPAATGGNSEERRTLNQILTEMDGFNTDTNVILIAATNRPDILDPALLRPGRFDRHVVLNRPDIVGREAILRVHTRGKPLAEGVDLADLASRTPGFVGADLANLVNEAAILAARRDQKEITLTEFRDAMTRVIAGAERKLLMTEEDKRDIAYHEAGHALVMHVLPGCDLVRHISIVPRGMSLGHTFVSPDRDRWGMTKAELTDRIAGLLGGRAAEELVFGADNVSTGAAGDLERATQIAREMVIRFGMGSHLRVSVRSAENYLGPGYVGSASSDDDAEIEQILQDGCKLALSILGDSEDVLNRLVEALLEEETIEREEFLAIVDR